MSTKNESEIFSKIIIALIVLLGSAAIWSIAREVWMDSGLSGWDQFIIGALLTLTVVGIIYVLIQKQRMNKTETFRREKW